MSLSTYEPVTNEDLASGIGPNYQPFLDHLHKVAAAIGPMVRVALVRLPMESGHFLCGAALVKVQSIERGLDSE